MSKSERDPTLAAIGARVRQRRRELGLTQEALASGAGVSKSFVSEVEGGLTAASGLIYLRLARMMEVQVQWLLTGEVVGELTHQSSVPVPPVLSEVAEEQGWSYRQTLDVAAALSGIVARRTRSGRAWELTREHILRIAAALPDGGDE